MRNITLSKEVINISRGVKKILSEKQSKKQENLVPLVKKFIGRKEEFLQVAQTFETPCYILDAKELRHSIKSFDKAFRKEIPDIRVYYAMKTNDNAYVLKAVAKHGWGLDVSSVREFDLAQKSGCKDLIYTGPAKTEKDLEYVLKKDPNIIVQIDSFGELERLGEVTKKLKKIVKAGVRISTASHKKWSKFGIPIKDLKTFWNYAEKFSNIKLQGIQFHLSWNEDAKPYQRAIKELSIYLKKNFTKSQLDTISFIDFGGGFRPYQSEGTFPWLLPQGNIIKTVNDYFDQPTDFAQKYLITPAVPIEEYANGIGKAITRYLKPLVSCDYFAEPGRIISNNSMHILLRVVDKKDKKNVIVDGGINAVGWERFEYEYFPVINLSKPSLIEQSCTLYGSLCMPQDLWGYYYYGSSINEGDFILVPNQGCLTYSWAQNFIRPIPPIYILE